MTHAMHQRFREGPLVSQSTLPVSHAAARRASLLRVLRVGLLLGGLSQVPGCAQVGTIPGTRITDTKDNRDILTRVEEYRIAMEQRDAPKLLTMAHPNYFEDSGTPSGADDYGYPGLKKVLDTRLPVLRSLRYAIQYRHLVVEGKRATLDIRYDMSYQIATEMGDRWERKQSDKRIELENDGNRWLFLSGM